MELGLVHGFFCLSMLVLGLVLLVIAFPAIAKKDLLKWIASAFQQSATELTEQEIQDNGLIDFDVAREFKLRKTLPNGSIFEDKITHGTFARNGFVVLNENKKITDGNFDKFVIRGENLLKVLKGDSTVVLEIEDNGTLTHLKSIIGIKNLEIANLQARVKELSASTKKQIVDEHEMRKEYTRARFGGNEPNKGSSPFSPFRRFGGGGSGSEGDSSEEV